MLWVLAYLIVGMICVSIMLQPALRKSVEEYKDDQTRIGIASLVIIILICFLTPLWPAFLTLKVVRLFSKRQEVK